MKRFAVRWESATQKGYRSVYARNIHEALRGNWQLYGQRDEQPIPVDITFFSVQEIKE